MRVITFLRVGFPLAQIISSLAPVAASRGAGSAGRSFVHSISIPKQVIRILMLKNPIMRIAVNRRKDSNKRTTAQVDIIATVRSGGPSGLSSPNRLKRKSNRLWNIQGLNETHKSVSITGRKPLR